MLSKRFFLSRLLFLYWHISFFHFSVTVQYIGIGLLFLFQMAFTNRVFFFSNVLLRFINAVSFLFYFFNVLRTQ
jgi:hypothetical protein